MIRGMSREKPALVFLRCIEIVWSLYEMMGDRTMKMGARTAVASFMSPSMVGGMRAKHATGGLSERSDSRGEQRRNGKPGWLPGRERRDSRLLGMLSVAHGCGVRCDGGRRSIGVLRKFGGSGLRCRLTHAKTRKKCVRVGVSARPGAGCGTGCGTGCGAGCGANPLHRTRDEPDKIRSSITSREREWEVILRLPCYNI